MFSSKYVQNIPAKSFVFGSAATFKNLTYLDRTPLSHKVIIKPRTDEQFSLTSLICSSVQFLKATESIHTTIL